MCTACVKCNACDSCPNTTSGELRALKSQHSDASVTLCGDHALGFKKHVRLCLRNCTESQQATCVQRMCGSMSRCLRWAQSGSAQILSTPRLSNTKQQCSGSAASTKPQQPSTLADCSTALTAQLTAPHTRPLSAMLGKVVHLGRAIGRQHEALHKGAPALLRHCLLLACPQKSHGGRLSSDRMAGGRLRCRAERGQRMAEQLC